MGEQPAMDHCETHHWVSTNVPDLLTRWVIQCSLCGAYNAKEMNAALSAAGFGLVGEATLQAADLIRDLIDSEDCHFDHHGGCQAHGYLSLQPGELCPQLEAKAWLHNREASS